jgi:hypothetical protein
MHFTVDTALGIAGVIVALVAIAMAAQPFVQGIWGTPELEINFTGGRYEVHPDVLACEITNRPIENRLLKLLRVYREDAKLSVTFAIYEYGSERLVADTTHAPLLGVTPTPKRIQEVSSGETALFPVVSYAGDAAKVVRRQDMDDEITLPYGRYIASIHLRDEKRNTHQEITKEFIVGRPNKELRWL